MLKIDITGPLSLALPKFISYNQGNIGRRLCCPGVIHKAGSEKAAVILWELQAAANWKEKATHEEMHVLRTGK